MGINNVLRSPALSSAIVVCPLLYSSVSSTNKIEPGPKVLSSPSLTVIVTFPDRDTTNCFSGAKCQALACVAGALRKITS